MRFRRVFCLAASILAALLLPDAARAVPTRVFLGLNGNNANDCSNPATPCYSFAGALAQVATGGEVIIEATGGYGPLTITKSVSINAAAGVVGFSGVTVTVNAPGGVVVIRGLTIDGGGAPSGNGINVVAVGTLHIESCVITGFPFNGSADTGNGIYFASSGQLFVKDTIVRGNAYYGIAVAPTSGTSKASIDNCRLEGNVAGLAAYLNSQITVRDSVASGNSFFGFGCVSTAELNIENCLAANNQNGIYGIDSTILTIRVSNTTVTDNAQGLFVGFANSILSRGNNTVEGNVTNGSFTGTFAAK